MTQGVTIKRLGDSRTGPVAIDQGLVHGWPLSYNPDDERWYVEREDGCAQATFAQHRNAVQYCRRHAKG